MTMRNGVLTDQKKLHLGSMEYFLALAHQIQTKDDAKGIELAAQLAALLEQQVYEYTLGDSSSVPIELAEALLQSVYYRIGLALKQRGGGALTLFPLRQLFDEGRQIAEKRVKKARQALFVLQRTSVDGGSIAYHDTVFKALPAFSGTTIRVFSHTRRPAISITSSACRWKSFAASNTWKHISCGCPSKTIFARILTPSDSKSC